MTSGWYDDPALRECVRKIGAVVRRAAHAPRRGAAEIGIVIDAEATLSMHIAPAHMVQLVGNACMEASRSGAPFETLLIDDLERCPPMKLYVFTTAVAADETKRRRLHDFLRERGAHALWLFAAGFVDGQVSCANASKLTGIELALPDAPRFLLTESSFGGRDAIFGSPYWHTRAPIVVDREAEILGRNQSSGLPEFARKKTCGFTSIYSASPAPSGSILRRLARDAGASIYLDTDDAVSACDAFVAVHARDAGVKRLFVPGCEALYDLVNEVEIPAPGGRATIYLARANTGLYFRGTRKAWNEVKDDVDDKVT
jgi:hypothetical protein